MVPTRGGQLAWRRQPEMNRAPTRRLGCSSDDITAGINMAATALAPEDSAQHHISFTTGCSGGGCHGTDVNAGETRRLCADAPGGAAPLPCCRHWP
ncbi:hypothetical protein HaLaN_29478, partial [Haematococcus lacustris]